MTKSELRTRIKMLKKQQTSETLDYQSRQIMDTLENHSAFKNAHRIMIYNALPDEVRTAEFIEKWRHDKRLILPAVVGDDIIPIELEAQTQFLEGDFKIMEPQNIPYTGNFDLIIVPCVACDKSGHRLGRGRGYYDRFLSQHLSVKRIGICFDFQLVEQVPTETFDIQMDEVITYANSLPQKYQFSDGEKIEANLDKLKILLTQNQQYLQNYLELSDHLSDDDYMARGNGFCDTKYSENFIESQKQKYQKRIQEITQWLDLWN